MSEQKKEREWIFTEAQPRGKCNRCREEKVEIKLGLCANCFGFGHGKRRLESHD